MRKLLILVLVSITAFLGVNLTKVSTYAATDFGGELEIEFNYSGGTLIEEFFTVDMYEYLHENIEYLTDVGNIQTADDPDVSTYISIEYTTTYTVDMRTGYLIRMTYFDGQLGFFLGNDGYFTGTVWDGVPEDGIQFLYLTFDIPTSLPVTYVTEGNRTYIEYDGERNLNQDLFTLNNLMRFEAPADAISIHVIDTLALEDQQVLFFDFDMTDAVFEINWTTLYFETVDDPDDRIVEYLDDSTFQIYFTIELPPIAGEFVEYKTIGNRVYLAFNDYTIIDVTKLNSTLSIGNIDVPDNVIGLYVADEFGSVLFDWNNPGYELTLPSIGGYDNLYIATSSSEFYIDVEGVDPYLTQIFVSYEEGLFPYSIEGYSKFQVYFELIPFENSVPIISGDTIVVNIDNPLPESTLRAEISAWDDLDGDITSSLVYVGGTYESARLAGTLVVGNNYTIIYSVEDSSSNVTQATINVQVVDITKPVFGIENTTTQISYTQTLNLESFKMNLLVTDNYDDYEDIVINILTNNYTANKLVPGSYTVVYRAIDTSTNYRDITITVVVIDNVGPVISGPNSFNVPLSPKTNISILLNQFTANDAIDGNVTSSIEVLSDTYTVATTPGIYSVTIRFTDESGNTTNKTFTISMSDGVPPILFITSGLLIGVNELQTLTVQQIITLLEAQGTITGFTVLSNTYAGNEDVPGTYQMVVAYTQNNVQYQQTLSILVTPSQLLQWTVSFMTNGGSNLLSVIVNDFGQLLIQAPSRTGYRFVGWYKDAELTQPFSMVTGRITQDTTLYAKWVPVGTAGPSIIIDNITNLKVVDIAIIVGTIALGVGVGFYFANKKKPTSKRKRG